MTLTTHAIVGVSVAQFFPNNPIAGLIAAIGSHYVTDVIPHISIADYFGSLKRGNDGRLRPLEGFIFGWRFVGDSFIVLADMLLGVLLAWLIWYNSASLIIILVGVIGGVLPDLLQIAYGFLRKNQILLFVRKIHDYMHAPVRLDIKNILLGTLVETVVIVMVVMSSKIF